MNSGRRAKRWERDRRIRLYHRAMFSAFRQLCERVLRIPPEPEPPPGDAASTQIFRAAPNYYKYLIALWALKTAAFVLIFAVAFAAPLIAAAVEMSRHR